MLAHELVEFINNNKFEDGHTEFKSAAKGFPKIYDTLSSFSNSSGGGIIIFGYDEKNKTVCGVYDAEKLQKEISNCCIQMQPEVRANCTIAQIDGKSIVSAEISEIEITKRPCFYKGAGIIHGSYIRVGDNDRKMTQYEIYSFEAFRKNIKDELRQEPRASIDDIDTPTLAQYLNNLIIAKPNFEKLDFNTILKLQGFTNNNVVTLAGILLFSEFAQSFFPQLCITAVVVDGFEMGDISANGARFLDNQKIEGTLSQMLTGAINFVRRNMAIQTTIDPKTGDRIDKPQYPIVAIREIILNALVHRDYSIHTENSPISIVMFKDRIEVANPGGLYGRITIDTLGEVSADTRNPFIASALEIEKITENRFSGIPTIKREMKVANLPEPVFYDNKNIFKVTLYNKSNITQEVDESGITQQILDFCKTKRSRDELEHRFVGITRAYLFSHFVNPLVELGELSLSLPDKPKSKNQKFFTPIK